MTNLIVLLQKMMGTSQVLANLISEVLKEKQLFTVVDIGSGSGGVMPDVMEHLKKDPELSGINLIMTDLYPNEKIIKKITELQNDHISYYPSSVDALHMAKAPAGLKTMVNSFHHMPPKKARKILESAQQNHQAFLIYELGENKLPLLLWWLLLPISLVILIIMVLFMTPFVRPMSWQQIVFTYLIPIIPICYAWDGQASLPRIYSLKDMDLLLEGLNSEQYTWTKGYAYKKNEKARYLCIGNTKLTDIINNLQ